MNLRAKRLTFICIVGACFLALLLTTYFLFLPFPRTSDAAASVLAGLDMRAGNWRLAGWWLPADNFTTSDIALYALLGRVPVSLYIAPALIWSALTALAVLASLHGLANWQRWRAAAAIVTLLGLPIMLPGGPARQLSESPMHIATLVYALACFLLLGAAVRRPILLAFYTVFLTLAVLGDPLAIVICALPALAVSVLYLRRGTDPELHRTICAATIAAILAAKLLLYLNEHAGGFAAAPLPFSLATPARLLTHVAMISAWLPQFLGADFYNRALPTLSHLGTAIFWLRAPYIVLFAAALILAARPLATGDVTRRDNLNLLLWFATMLNLLSAAFTGIIADAESARVIIPAFVFGSILLARTQLTPRFAGAYTAIALVASLLFTGRILATASPTPAYAAPELQALAADLRAHGPNTGYGPYWTAAMVTVLSQETVTMRAIWRDGTAPLRPIPWLASAAWYRSLAGQKTGNIFFVSCNNPGPNYLPESDIISFMGKPVARRQVGYYNIDIYNASNPALRGLKP